MTNYNMTLLDACRVIAQRNSLHARVKLVALNQGREKAEKVLMDRCRGDIEDALFESPERDDPAALAAHVINSSRGLRALIVLSHEVKLAVIDRVEEMS